MGSPRNRQFEFRREVSGMMRAAWLAVFLAPWIVACASFSPTPVEEVPFKERAKTEIAGGLTVSVAVPTMAEAEAIYGVDLASRKIQPIWVEVVNHEKEKIYWFLEAGLDAHYFTPTEAAFAFHRGRGSRAGAMDSHFTSLGFRNPIRPGETVSGFVLVNLDEGYKAVEIDLICREDARSFTLVFVDPEFKADFTLVDFESLWSEGEIVAIENEEELRAALTALPTCTTNKAGDEEGDPLNLVMVGKRPDIFAALVRRGWHATEFVSTRSFWRTVRSFLRGSRYRYSPISPLYVFGRSQDFAAQKARGSVNQRNHMRYWLTPIRYRGQEVWVGQISRDIGVKFTFKSPTISTHKIDPDVDESRRYLLEDLLYSQAVHTIAFVQGVGRVEPSDPRYNLVGDPYFTDGCRAVMFFGPRPNGLEDISVLAWEVPRRSRGKEILE